MRNLVMSVMIAATSQIFPADTNDGSQSIDPEHVRSGSAVYEQHCASCHGAKAEGVPNWQVRDANGELPAPPHNAEGHTWRHSDTELYEMVSEGWRDPFNKTTRLTMPAFGSVLSPDQIRAVITYLKTLWTPEQTEFQSEESKGHPSPSAGK